MRFIRASFLIILLVSMFTFLGSGECEDVDKEKKKAETSRWSLSPSIGYYFPSLKTLNEKKFKEDPDKPVPEINGGYNLGLEVQYDVNERHGLSIGTVFWEGESIATENSMSGFEVFGLVPMNRMRRFKVTMNQYWFNWNYHFINEPSRYKLFLKVGFYGFADITYKEDLVLTFDTPEGAFKRISLKEAKATGGYMAQVGLGGMFFIKKWLSVGLNSTFIFGRSNFLRISDARNNFTQTEGGESISPDRGTVVSFNDAGVPRALQIELDGWQVSSVVRVHF